MKNIHVLPTDKPTRLFITDGKLFNYHKPQQGDGVKIINQNIYITSDEEIKEGDWCYHPLLKGGCIIQSKFDNPNSTMKKIILTTDKDLIKDGVQKIDDEFLEWFVKNPSCESVEIKWVKTPDGIFYHQDNVPYGCYKIIIPKEEQDYTALLKQVGTKQETPEEVALKYFPKTNSHFDRLDEVDGNAYYRSIFKQGAKWQAERMYSEEEVLELLNKFEYYPTMYRGNSESELKEWLEQFKKK